jgi:hypothetical protein
MADDKQSDGANLNSSGDTNIGGDVVGRDKITTTSSSTTNIGADSVEGDKVTATTNIEGGPVARYAVIGIIMVAIVAIIAVALRGGIPSTPTPGMTPIPTVAPAFTSAPPTATATPVSTAPYTPTEPTATFVQPTSTNTSVPPISYFTSCIDSQTWRYLPASIEPQEKAGCWLLNDNAWGFSVQNDGLTLALNNVNANQQRGIFTSLLENADIGFTIRIEQFQTQYSDIPARISLGVIQTNPVSLFKSGLLSYAVDSSGSSYVNLILTENEKPLSYNSALDFKTAQSVTFSLRSSLLNVCINGIRSGEPIVVGSDRAFYIGYNLRQTIKLVVEISAFSIQPNDGPACGR